MLLTVNLVIVCETIHQNFNLTQYPLIYKNQLFWKAMNYLKIALKYEAGSHPVVHHCLGQSYIALGMLKVNQNVSNAVILLGP